MLVTDIIKNISDEDLEYIHKNGMTSDLFLRYAIQVKVLYSAKDMNEASQITKNLIYKEIANRYFDKISEDRKIQKLICEVYE